MPDGWREGVGPGGGVGAVEPPDNGSRGPARGLVALERLPAAAAGVRARPVDRGGDEPVALEPEAVGAADCLACPARPRLRLAALAVTRRPALAVGARGGRRTLARAGVARLAGLGLLAGRVVQVAPDGRGCAVEQARDLRDRPPRWRWCWASRTLRRRSSVRAATPGAADGVAAGGGSTVSGTGGQLLSVLRAACRCGWPDAAVSIRRLAFPGHVAVSSVAANSAGKGRSRRRGAGPLEAVALERGHARPMPRRRG